MTEYDGLFYDWGRMNSEPVTQSDVALAEKRLGFRLPPAYVELLQHRNGGILQRCISRAAVINGQPATMGIIQILGIGCEDGLDEIVDGKTINRILIHNWGYPPNSVVFAPQGSAGYAFDYENLDDTGEPTILYRNCDCVLPVTHRRVFQNFRQLIESLEPM